MNGIGSIGGGMNFMQGMQGMRKPDPEEMAQELFARLDTDGQGYLEKSDLASALSKVSSASEAASLNTDDSDLDELFSQLDSDGDGKITEQELSDSLALVDEQINNLFSQMRMDEAQGQMMPPPPPPDESGNIDEAGFTLEELTAQLEEIGDSDPERSTLIQNIIDNFDEADTDGDGRVSFREAMTYDQENSESGNNSAVASDESSSDTNTLNERVMLQIMRLVQAYNPGGQADSESSSTISVSA